MNVLRAILFFIRFCMVFCGLIMMMCETPDPVMQNWSLFGGLALFILGLLPALIRSIKGEFDNEY